MKPLVSIIICTYNRAEILSRCLDSLINNVMPSYPIELLIVDNNSEDHTTRLISSFNKKTEKLFPSIYIKEKTVGLSYARNTGLENAKASWVFYLDDDAMITPTFYAELKNCIDRGFLGFTGVFSPYYITEKPDWLHDSFGSKKSQRLSIGPLDNDYLCGGVMGFKTEVLKDIGGFPSSLGMTGDKIAYGEETYVENMFRERNYALGINPRLEILHLVHPRKYSFMWNLKSSFAIGQSQKKIGLVNHNLISDSLRIFFRHSFLEVPKLLLYRYFKEQYSLKYLSLQVLQTYCHLLGRLF